MSLLALLAATVAVLRAAVGAAQLRVVEPGASLRPAALADEAPAVAFVAGAAPRRLLNRRPSQQQESNVAMHGGSRRQGRYNMPKKNHIRFNDRYIQRMMWDVPPVFMAMTHKKEPTLEYWSQTLKLTFPEGEDDCVTEEEVMEYFTTPDYKAEACIVGHKLPHDDLKHAYVHFATNDEAIKARKEKDGGSIGKASEVKVVYTDEKKWIRLRDGVALQGGQRASWMKAYGWKAQPGWAEDWAEETGTRSHPVYPE